MITKITCMLDHDFRVMPVSESSATQHGMATRRAWIFSMTLFNDIQCCVVKLSVTGTTCQAGQQSECLSVTARMTSASADQPPNQAVKRTGTHLTKFKVTGAETAAMPTMACFLAAACNKLLLQTVTKSQADDLKALQHCNPITKS